MVAFKARIFAFWFWDASPASMILRASVGFAAYQEKSCEFNSGLHVVRLELNDRLQVRSCSTVIPIIFFNLGELEPGRGVIFLELYRVFKFDGCLGGVVRGDELHALVIVRFRLLVFRSAARECDYSREAKGYPEATWRRMKQVITQVLRS